MERIYALMAGVGPRQLQFDFALWTREMVREVIRREFGGRRSAVSVGRLLRKMGLSPQRPVGLATQQNPDAVEEFKTEVFPKIPAEKAARDGKVWFADETEVRSAYHTGTSWEPVGRRPVVNSTMSRHSVDMISAVAPDGSLRFDTYTCRFASTEFIDFCNKLLHGAPGPALLVIDEHPTHRSKATKGLIVSTNGRLKFYHLPGYSPQLTPEEWVWDNVKAAKIGRAGITNQDGLWASTAGSSPTTT